MDTWENSVNMGQNILQKLKKLRGNSRKNSNEKRGNRVDRWKNSVYTWKIAWIRYMGGKCGQIVWMR